MSEKRRGLGRGLGALIPSGPATSAQETTKVKAAEPTAKETAAKTTSARTKTTTKTKSTTARNAADAAEQQKKSPRSTATTKSGTSTGTSNKTGTGRKTTSKSQTSEAPNTSRTKAAEKSAAPRSGAGKNASAQKVTDVSRETSAIRHDQASSTKEQAASPSTDSAKTQAKTAKTSPRTRRDMGQALRSTTTVRRPVDMFFLPSDAAAEVQGEDGFNESSPLNSGQSTDPSGSDSETAPIVSDTKGDVSRETSQGRTGEKARDRNPLIKSDSSVYENTAASLESNSSADTAVEGFASQEGVPDAATSSVALTVESDTAAQQAADQTEDSGRESSSDDVSRETSSGAETAPKPETLPALDEELHGEDLAAVPGARFAEVSVTDIHPNRKQPRQVFDEDELAELAFSVKELGVLQPVVVRPSREGEGTKYELVMGERRWRAVQKAGLESIPAIIRETSDDDLLRDALLENLHRSQLNPLEEAAAYQQLLEEFGATQDELSRRIGRSRPQISNTLRLLRLPPLVQRRVAAGVLSSGHARALLGLTDPAEMERLAQRIVAEGMSVRATEETVALSDGLKRHATKRKTPSHRHDDRLNYIADAFSDRLDTSVKIQLGARKGKMTIEFASVEDLNRIIDVLDPKMENSN